MGQGVAILVVFSSEAFLVEFAGSYWALFRPLALMGQHVAPQVSNNTTAVRSRTDASAPSFTVIFTARLREPRSVRRH